MSAGRARSGQGLRPWFELAFGRGYLAVYPHRNLRAARAEVAELLRAGVRGRILDLGCGFGRHALAFAEQGLDVFGLDLSGELLSHAAELERGQPGRITGRLVRGDFRHLPYGAARFDTVCMLFSSFGYFDDEGNGAVLRELRRVLVPGGRAVLDLMNPLRIRASLVPSSVHERDGFRLFETRALIDDGRRVTKDVRLEPLDGSPVRSWREDVRLYESQELHELMHQAGFEVECIHGDFDGRSLSADSPRQVVWAVR